MAPASRHAPEVSLRQGAAGPIETTRTIPTRVLMVVANGGISTVTGWPIGFWASELVHPWYEFRQSGYQVTIASPEGGRAEVDAISDPRDERGYCSDDVLSRGFFEHPTLAGLLESTPALGDLDIDRFDAVVACGGEAPMFQFRDHETLKQVLARMYESEKPTAALCHGVSALIDVQLSDGSYLVEGKTITGVSNAEEDLADEAAGRTVQPWRIEDAARERGANYVAAGPLRAFAVRDRQLVTGQQQNSSRKVAELVIACLGT